MNMNKPPRLTVELVPRSQWGANLATSLHGARWNALREVTLRRPGYRCEVCGGAGSLEAHEEWDYENPTGIQRLVRLVALCAACHEVKHIGRAGVRGRGPLPKRTWPRSTDGRRSRHVPTSAACSRCGSSAASAPGPSIFRSWRSTGSSPRLIQRSALREHGGQRRGA